MAMAVVSEPFLRSRDTDSTASSSDIEPSPCVA